MAPYKETLELRITIYYYGVKATQYFSKFTPESEEVLRRDLLTLRLPAPKRSNMRLLSHGIAQVYWTGVYKSNKILRQPLQAKLKGDIPPSELYKEEFEDLSITNIVLKELAEPVADRVDDNMVTFVPAKTVEGGASASYSASRPTKLKKSRFGDFNATDSGVSDRPLAYHKQRIIAIIDTILVLMEYSLENRISKSTAKISDRDIYPDLTRDEVEWIIEDGLHRTIHPSGPVPSTQLARTILFSIRHLRFVEGVSFFDAGQKLPPDEVDHLLAIMFYQRLNTGVPSAADAVFDLMMNRLCTNNDLCREKSLIYVNRALKKLISKTYKKDLMPYFFSDPKHPERVLDLVVIDLIANYPPQVSEEMPHRFGRTRGLNPSAYSHASSSKYDRYHDERDHHDWDWDRGESSISAAAKYSKPLRATSTSPRPQRIELPKVSKPEPERLIPRKRSPSIPSTPIVPVRSHVPPTGPAAMRTISSHSATPKLAPVFVKTSIDLQQEEVAKLREQVQKLEADVQRQKQLQQDQDAEWKKKLDEQQKLSMELNDNIMAVSLEEKTRMLEEETELRNMLTNEQQRHEQALKMVEEELLKERQRRVLAEETLEDVRRECRAPFIVPALMEAFIHVSRTSTVLMQEAPTKNATGSAEVVPRSGTHQVAPAPAAAPLSIPLPARTPISARVKREWHD